MGASIACKLDLLRLLRITLALMSDTQDLLREIIIFFSCKRIFIDSAYYIEYFRISKVIMQVSLYNSVMRVGSDTFGDPIFQKGLQNY